MGNGLVIPAGPLREKIEQINKYDVAIVNGNGENISSLKKYLLKFNKNLKVFKGIYVLNHDKKGLPSNLNHGVKYAIKEEYK